MYARLLFKTPTTSLFCPSYRTISSKTALINFFPWSELVIMGNYVYECQSFVETDKGLQMWVVPCVKLWIHYRIRYCVGPLMLAPCPISLCHAYNALVTRTDPEIISHLLVSTNIVSTSTISIRELDVSHKPIGYIGQLSVGKMLLYGFLFRDRFRTFDNGHSLSITLLSSYFQ